MMSVVRPLVFSQYFHGNTKSREEEESWRSTSSGVGKEVVVGEGVEGRAGRADCVVLERLSLQAFISELTITRPGRRP